MQGDVSLVLLFLAAALTALATGLGALPFAFTRDFPDRWLGAFNAAAAGLMMAASHGLLTEGQQRDAAYTVLGLAIGVGLVALADRWIDRHDTPSVADLQGADARKALLVLGVMTAHSFAEGIGVGVSFGGGQDLGVFITLAIAVQNIPEGLAISLVLVPRGSSVARAAGWSVFSSLPQPLMAVPAYLFFTTFRPFLPLGMGIAAGAMIWMVFSELVPDAMRHLPTSVVATVLVSCFTAMAALQFLLG